MENLAKLIGVSTEIRTGNHKNTSQNCYRLRNRDPRILFQKADGIMSLRRVGHMWKVNVRICFKGMEYHGVNMAYIAECS
jgi:hypothetical protein